MRCGSFELCWQGIGFAAGELVPCGCEQVLAVASGRNSGPFGPGMADVEAGKRKARTIPSLMFDGSLG